MSNNCFSKIVPVVK